jgi:hypothetical protein
MTRSIGQVRPAPPREPLSDRADAAALDRAVAPAPALDASETLSGQVVYMYAFDVAYEMTRQPVRELLGQPVAQFAVDASKRSPRQLFFYRPQMVRLPPLEKLGPHGTLRVERTVKILPVGAISITVRVPFRAEKLEDLVAFHDLRFSDGTWLYDEVRDLAEQVRQELRSYYVRPVDRLVEEEAYTVFCVSSPLRDGSGNPLRAEQWLHERRRDVASLLTEERDAARLSDQEADESSCKYFSYYEHDLVVIDWDAALIVDEPRNFDEVLYLMELANLQLAELEAYDRLLDDAVERAYRDVAPRRALGTRRSALSTRDQLREIRIDLARLSDELSNITKFFGDWHLARIYKGLSDRFHLSDWHRTIDEKLKTLDDLYQLLRADQMNRWMLILEATIVALFVLDIVMILWWK